MGILRLLLAVIVVIHHIPGYLAGNPSFPFIMTWVDAMVCVLIFFIFSGFYMSLIINEKYSKSPNFPASFYLSRALRIYPLYWIILALVFIFDMINGHLGNVGNIQNLRGFQWFAQVLMNLTTLGLDLVPSLGGYTFQLIGPAWSLGSELLFYLGAPWLVRLNWRQTATLILIIFAIRIELYALGYDRYPLRVLFFPFSLVFFLLGHLSYLTLTKFRQSSWLKSMPRTWLGLLSLFGILASSVVLGVGRGIDPDSFNLWVFYLIITLSIPVIFLGLHRSKLDRFLGNLSFPLYISHSLVLTFIAIYVGGSKAEQPFVALSLSIIVAIFLTLAIEAPIERMRAIISASIMRSRSSPSFLDTENLIDEADTNSGPLSKLI